jgi:uncharacterized protein YbjT (DUF2867 family)
VADLAADLAVSRRSHLWYDWFMKIVVMGGTGLIGSKVVARLTGLGHEAVAASPSSGVNAYTGEGLAGALTGAGAVVDVTNAPSFEPAAVLDFFTTSTANLLGAEKEAGVVHHVALSIVGAERLPKGGYLRAKTEQEKLIAASGVPFSIVKATQFYEFVKGIADGATVDDVVRLPTQLIQPIAADDVAEVVAQTAAGPPLDGAIEIGGPQAFPMDEFIRDGLSRLGDERVVIGDATAEYFGTVLEKRSLVPGDDGQLSELTFDEWSRR